MATTRTRALPLAAATLGVTAVGLLLAVFVLEDELTRVWVFWAAFLVAMAAIVLAAVARLRGRRERPAVRPLTTTGRWAVGLSAAGLVLGAVGPVLTVVRQDSGTEPALVVVAPVLLALGAMIAGGVTALIAWFRHGERSVLVLLCVLPALLALSLLIGEFVFPH
jgi:hypothetical protein